MKDSQTAAMSTEPDLTEILTMQMIAVSRDCEGHRYHYITVTLSYIFVQLEPGFLPRNYLCFYWPAIQHSVLGLHRECSIRVISYWRSSDEGKKGTALLQSVVTHIGMTSKMEALVSVHDCIIYW